MKNNKDSGEKKNKRKAVPKRYFVVVAAFVVAVLLVYLLVNIYVTKTMTWDSLFAGAGLREPISTEDYEAPKRPLVLAEGEVSVHFLYVGQADCTVILDGDTVVMIDAGDWYSKEAIFGFLDSYGIRRIDYFFLTHPHTDHMGSLAALVQNYEIGQVYFTNHPEDLTPTNTTYTQLLETLFETRTPTMTVTTGMTVPLRYGTVTVDYDPVNNDLNNCSSVLRYSYGETSFLFMGDAETQVEDQMLGYGFAQQADVLKVGHHSSKKATSSRFLQVVQPAYAVISCGINNDYGYPKEEVLSRLDAVGAAVLRTDTMGDIVFVSDGQTVRLWQQQEDAA